MVALAIASVGAHGALGATALQLAMCARARKLEPQPCRFSDRRGRSVGACLAGGVDDRTEGYERLLALATPALQEAWSDRPAGTRGDVPLFLAVPEAGRPDDDPRLAGDVLVALAASSGVPIDLARSRVFRAGHAGGVLAVEAAAAELSAASKGHTALVGGVDSWYHAGVIDWLDGHYRLHAHDVEDGFLPGEGAAFALLGLDAPGRARGGRIVDVATGREDTVASGEPNIAEAMTDLVHRLVDAASGPVGWVLSDVNGERHRILEWVKVAIRASLDPGSQEVRLPDLLGDVGAASAPMLLALASIWWRTGCAPAGRALATLHSDGPERGAMLLEASP